MKNLLLYVLIHALNVCVCNSISLFDLHSKYFTTILESYFRTIFLIVSITAASVKIKNFVGILDKKVLFLYQ